MSTRKVYAIIAIVFYLVLTGKVLHGIDITIRKLTERVEQLERAK